METQLVPEFRMHDFEYEAPASIDDAVALMVAHPTARPLAGGTDLIDHVRTSRLTPDVLVDLKKIPELNLLEVSADGLNVGAAVPCYRIYENADIAKNYSAITDSCHIIGGIQIQSRATIGGNLCNSGPAADSTPSMIALNAVCVIAGPNGSREVAVGDFCTAPGKNVLQAGEILVSVKFPAPVANSGSAYLRFIPRNEMDIAVVSVGAAIVLSADGKTFESARIALGAVGPTPIFAEEAGRALAGQPVVDASIQLAVDAARAAAKPIDDMRGTVEFRKHVSGVLTERALRKAIERAQV